MIPCQLLYGAGHYCGQQVYNLVKTQLAGTWLGSTVGQLKRPAPPNTVIVITLPKVKELGLAACVYKAPFAEPPSPGFHCIRPPFILLSFAPGEASGRLFNSSPSFVVNKDTHRHRLRGLY